MEPLDSVLRRGWTFLVEKPLEFARDPETGRAGLIFFSSAHFQGKTIETPVGLVLTKEAAQALLRDLSELETLLRAATSGHTKPDSVQ
jgi:hypothetical protein